MELRKELIDFLITENKHKNITLYCNANELADRFLKSIKSNTNTDKVCKTIKRVDPCSICNKGMDMCKYCSNG